MTTTNFVILYGFGGLSDVGRHAILAAFERPVEEIGHITIITQYPESITDENNTDWNCGCTENEPSHKLSTYDKNRFTIVSIEKEKSWDDIDLSPYLIHNEATSTKIISCIGNRQPFIGHWDATAGNAAILRAIEKINSTSTKTKQTFRIVILTACGIQEDWPAFEYFTIARIATWVIFRLLGRTMYNDLNNMELLYQKSSSDTVNYLLVRPVGITEDVVPSNQWILQKEKYKHVLGFEMAKLDVARYMIQEVINPTRTRCAVVIGADPTLRVQRATKKSTSK
jgi:hypothetical protein